MQHPTHDAVPSSGEPRHVLSRPRHARFAPCHACESDEGWRSIADRTPLRAFSQPQHWLGELKMVSLKTQHLSDLTCCSKTEHPSRFESDPRSRQMPDVRVRGEPVRSQTRVRRVESCLRFTELRSLGGATKLRVDPGFHDSVCRLRPKLLAAQDCRFPLSRSSRNSIVCAQFCWNAYFV